MTEDKGKLGIAGQDFQVLERMFYRLILLDKYFLCHLLEESFA